VFLVFEILENMKIGIVGLPNVGKSTLFNALTKSYAADAGNFPFCTIEPNVGIVDVKDPRMDALAKFSNTQKTIYSTIEFVDIAWLVKGAGKWEWLGNKFLSHIREVDAIVQVLRHFDDSDVVHVEWNVDPERDIDVINSELIFADLEQLDRKLPSMQKKARVTWDKDLKKELEILEKIHAVLNNNKMANTLRPELSENDLKTIKSYNLLTMKPLVYALNVWQNEFMKANDLQKEFSEKLWAPVAIVCAKLESELLELDSADKKEFMQDILEAEHIDHLPILDDLIGLAFKTVGLMYYFTTWEKETRAWTIPINATAPQAAWAIHTDFERGFIKAEVINCELLLEAWSWAKAKEKWILRLEWKNYIVQDGDVIVFKFNV